MSTKEKYEQTKLPMVPIRDVVIFPFMMVPFVIGRESSVNALETALRGDKRIFLATQHDATVDNPKPNEIYQVGTISNIVQSLKLPDGNTKVIVEGIERARILQLVEEEVFWKANLRLSPFRNQSFSGYDTVASRLSTQFEQYVKLSQNLNADQALASIKVDDVGRLADTICAHMVLSIEEKQELKRLEMMPPMSAESTVSRNYLDWLLAMPWKKRSREIRDIETAERVLNEDHYGLDKVKERILEFLAVRQLVKKPKGSILCFVGPPGVGKTSLGMSIARATGRKFVRLALGGVRDEAEIRGHRRTYIGALPGQIIQMIKKAGVINPVFLLDEVDKMSMDFRGDPSAALLEVLDPEQNSTFQDHYLDVEYDLSQIMFIATANVLHTIPQPLQDRMEILRLPGYTEYEKVEIARRFLIRKQIEANGLSTHNVSFKDDAIQGVIRHYTREAGVRNLEREISSICRKVTRLVVKEGPKNSVTVSDENVVDYIGIPKYRSNRHESLNEIGFVTGLAWTEVGGEILATEATLMEGKGKLTLTGKLGDVMQESAQAAMSYVRSRAQKFGIPKDFYRRLDLHIHVPEGAIPKDGPSAGITMATSLVSALTQIPVRCDVAMTGEITLRGKVLPIGGVKEKLLAAHRAGIRTLILPKDNQKDLADIPANIKDEFTIHFVENMDEVLKVALTYKPTPLVEDAAGAVPFRPPVGGDGDLQESIMH